MDRGNVLSGAAFSAVLMSAMAFLVVLITVGFVSHGYVQRSMTAELRDEVQSRWDLLAANYRDGGRDHLADLIGTATLLTNQGERALGLFDVNGTSVVGNIASRPAASGWHQAPLVLTTENNHRQAMDRPADFLYRSEGLDGYTLVVGQRMDPISRIDRAMFRTLATTGFIVVLAMLGAGYFISRKSLRKLEQFETALAQVSDGDMTARMAISPENDQIDRIAGRMNAHLDTLSRLMISTRATAAAVAHDLKSPLARAYMALGRALARVEVGEDPRVEIEDTQAELERMNAIFDTFLRLARIEAGADGARLAEVDLGALLDDLADTYQMVAEDNGQSLVYLRPEGERFSMTGDATMLQQMIVNLLQNAVTHGNEGTRIRLTLDHMADRIRMTVADNGPGIPEAARDAVFEPFHRLDPSRHKPGSGLGLALVRAIAERHGANITLSDNSPGLRVIVEFAPRVPVNGLPDPA